MQISSEKKSLLPGNKASSGFFYVLTMMTDTSTSFRAEELGASKVVTSIFLYPHILYYKNMFLVYKHSRQLRLLFLKKVLYITEISSSLPTFIDPPDSRTPGSLLWPPVCNWLLKFPSDPNSPSSTKTLILLLARTPGGSYFQHEGMRKQVFYRFYGRLF